MMNAGRACLRLLLLPTMALARNNQPNDHAPWDCRDRRLRGGRPGAAAGTGGAVLFIGSSSIRFWTTLATDFPEVAHDQPRLRRLGNRRCHLFADRIVAPYHPRAIVMYAGDNDLEDGDSPAHVLRGLPAFVRKARAVDPGRADRLHRDQAEHGAQGPAAADPRGEPAQVRDWSADSQPGVSYLDIFTPMLGKDGQPAATGSSPTACT